MKIQGMNAGRRRRNSAIERFLMVMAENSAGCPLHFGHLRRFYPSAALSSK
jgi:hypothetical protein